MQKLRIWVGRYIGVVVTLIFLGIHLFLINDYGLTWDFHFHFFGGGKLLGYSWQQLEPRALPYVEPDPRNAWSLPYGPLMSIPPVASFIMFHKILRLLPADSAYHLPIILWGVAGIAIVYFFLKEAINRRVALFSALFLALMPRYFGDMHNNMKDIPSAVIFSLNIWLLWRLAKHKRLIDLLLAVAAFAVAFNVKINSVYIPIVFGAWYLLARISWRAVRNKIIAARFPSLKRGDKKYDDTRAAEQNNFTTNSTRQNTIIGIYFLLAPIAAFLLWWFFWPNPVAQLDHAYRTFGIGTNNIEVLLNGAWFCSGSTVPWYYPLWYLGITTPAILLILFFVGTARGFADKKNTSLFTLLLLWLFLPLTRYLMPNIGVIDGIRHFEEVLFPIAIISGLGLDYCMTFLKNHAFKFALFILTTIYLLFTIYSYHPYQITYFNELVGGARGAFGKYDLDYWGTSQKAAVEWLNKHAPPNAKVHIVMAANVAGTYLRPDLLNNLNKYGYDQSDFVVILNRQSFIYRFFYVYEYLLRHTPAHTVSIAGAPLTWIFDNRTENKTARQLPWWQDEDPCIIKYWRGEKP